MPSEGRLAEGVPSAWPMRILFPHVAPERLPPSLHVIEGGRPHEADRDLATRVAGGCRRSSGELYDRYASRVDATLCRVLGRRTPEHDDLVQMTFVQVVLSLKSYRGECSLATWVSRVTANTAFNALRSRRRTRAVFDESADEDAAGHDLDPAVALRLRDALATLGYAKAEAVLLHDLLGHDLAEVATMLGVTVAAAQSRLVRARKELRELLADLEPLRGGRHA